MSPMRRFWWVVLLWACRSPAAPCEPWIADRLQRSGDPARIVATAESVTLEYPSGVAWWYGWADDVCHIELR